MKTTHPAIIGIMVAATIMLALGACAPVPDQVMVVSDSTGWLANWYGADWRGAEGHFTLGARADNPPGNHQDQVNSAVNSPTRSPQVLAMIYGHNYVSTQVSLPDQQELGRMVHSVMDNGGCVVLVLPAYTGTNANHRAMIDRYRAWATGVAARYPRGVVLADWQPVADAHPEHWVDADGTPTDGIHMSNQADGRLYSDAVNAAVDSCFALVS